MMAIEVEDMDKAVEYLKSKGVEISAPGELGSLQAGRDQGPRWPGDRTAAVVGR